MSGARFQKAFKRAVENAVTKASKPGILGRADGVIYYTDPGATEHKSTVYIRSGQDHQILTLAIVERRGLPEVPGLPIRYTERHGWRYVTDWDDDSPLLEGTPWEPGGGGNGGGNGGGGLDCAECDTVVCDGGFGAKEPISFLPHDTEFEWLIHDNDNAVVLNDDLVVMSLTHRDESFVTRQYVVALSTAGDDIQAGTPVKVGGVVDEMTTQAFNVHTVHRLTDTKFVLFMGSRDQRPPGYGGNGHSCFAVAGEVDGLTITLGEPVLVNTMNIVHALVSGGGFSIDSTRVCVHYCQPPTMYANVLTVTGLSISVGTRMSVTPTIGYADHALFRTFTVPLSATEALIVYGASGDALRAFRLSVSGTTVTYHGEQEIADNWPSLGALPRLGAVASLGSGRFVAIGTDPGTFPASSVIAQAFQWASGDTITAGSIETIYASGTDGWMPSLPHIEQEAVITIDEEQHVVVGVRMRNAEEEEHVGALAFGVVDLEPQSATAIYVEQSTGATEYILTELALGALSLGNRALLMGAIIDTTQEPGDIFYPGALRGTFLAGCEISTLSLSGALFLPDLDTEPPAPASGALIYAYQGVARVVDANGARDL